LEPYNSKKRVKLLVRLVKVKANIRHFGGALRCQDIILEFDL
jgi:hypothetical protein